jgi:hypothetical protein
MNAGSNPGSERRGTYAVKKPLRGLTYRSLSDVVLASSPRLKKPLRGLRASMPLAR